MRRSRLKAAILFLWFLPLPGQQVVAPTNEPVGPLRGENRGNYNITDSFELGVRWHQVDGNTGKYRSDVNFGNGLRLLSGSFIAHSRDGHGSYFDDLTLTTQGLGNDPYEFGSLRIEKNSLYRYELMWRELDYFNPGLTISDGLHLIDTSRRLQDHSLTLLPQSKLKLFLGYGRNSQDGPALSTLQQSPFPLFTNIRRLQDEYRLGGEVQLFGIKLTAVRSWEYFRDDTTGQTQIPSTGNTVPITNVLTSLTRDQPYHGSTDSWRVHLFSETNSHYALSGRFTYAAGRRHFVFDESASGANVFGSGTLQSQIFGNASRPVLAANLTASLFVTSKITVVNHTAFDQIRIDGNSTFLQVINPGLSNGFALPATANFEFLGIRAFSNSTDVNYQVGKKIALYGGYQFSTRRIQSIQQQSEADGVLAGVQTNHLHSGLFGVRYRPLQPLTLTADAEIGRSDHPFYPISEKNYQVLGGRAIFKRKTLLLSASAKTNYNINSAALNAYSSHSRTYSADASWTPLTWVSFDLGYSKLHLNTLTGIAYFLAGSAVKDQSYYVSNIHAPNFGVRFDLRRRVELYVGYSRIQDLGDGRSQPDATPRPSVGPPLFNLAQSFPLRFDSPLARVSVRLSEKLRWNTGYQFYRYREDFDFLQNYSAHTGYSSVTWSF